MAKRTKTSDARGVERLDVFRNSERVGVLRRTAQGSVFEYDEAFWAVYGGKPGGLATSLSFLNRRVETSGVNLPTYFAGLLPEGLRFTAMLKRAKTSADDLFTLLVMSGADTVGDVFAVLPGSTPNLEDDGVNEPLDQVNFKTLFDASLEAAGEPTVPGVQDKVSPAAISFPFVTRGRRWLLKLEPDERPGLVKNEFVFMQLAKVCGLNVPKAELVRDSTGAPGLLVERFDRRRENRRWVGVHQEDACQLLDLYPSEKYRVSTGAIAKAFVRHSAAPIVEVLRLLELVTFSTLIGNGDLHAKNVSLAGPIGELQLSPAYDLLCTRPYGDLKLALEFEGRNDNVKRHHLIDFGERHRVPARAVEAMVDRLIPPVRAFANDGVAQLGLDRKRTKQVEALMLRRCDALSK